MVALAAAKVDATYEQPNPCDDNYQCPAFFGIWIRYTNERAEDARYEEGTESIVRKLATFPRQF